jgi:hypothetical protein
MLWPFSASALDVVVVQQYMEPALCDLDTQAVEHLADSSILVVDVGIPGEVVRATYPVDVRLEAQNVEAM